MNQPTSENTPDLSDFLDAERVERERAQLVGPVDPRALLQKDLLAILKVSRTTLDNWKRNGCPFSTNEDGEVRYDAAHVLAWRVGYESERCKRDQSSEPDEQTQAMARLRRANAEKAELEAARLRGALIDAGEHRRLIYEGAEQLRQRFRRLPADLAPRLARNKDRVQIEQELHEAINSALALCHKQDIA